MIQATAARQKPTDRELQRAVLRVGQGRGFVVERLVENIKGNAHAERIVITAAHCLLRLPKPFFGQTTDRVTYQNLLGPLERKGRTISTELLFADVMNDVAHPRNLSRSSASTPRSSQIMRMGSGSASWLMSSAGGPADSIVSSRSSTIACALGRSCSTRRAVNSRLTSRLTRV